MTALELYDNEAFGVSVIRRALHLPGELTDPIQSVVLILFVDLEAPKAVKLSELGNLMYR